NFCHFADEFVEEFVGLLVGGIHRGIEDAPAALDLIGTGAAGELWVADEPRSAMAGHVEFGNDANTAIAGVGDQIANFVLRVVEAIGTEFVELREFLAFDAEALIFRKVPVEDIHLHGFHAVKIPAEYIEGNEVAAGVDHQAAPRKAWAVVDFYDR